MKFHALADLMPRMSDEDYARLRDDIAANGLLEPITVHGDEVLDGRHRLRACEDLGITPRLAEYDGDSPAQFVLSCNLHRRHLTAAQRAMIASDFLPHLETEARERQGAGLRRGTTPAQAEAAPCANTLAHGERIPPDRSSERAGALVGVSHTSVERAIAVKRKDPKLAEQIRNGDVALSVAYAQVRDRPTNGKRGLPLPVATRDELSTRGGQVANKTRERIHGALATLDGIATGLNDLSLVNVGLVTTDDEASHWHTQLRDAVDALRRFERALKEAQL